MVETNINGLFFMTRAILPYLVTQKSGHIVNISSSPGRLPLKGASGYAARKLAVRGFSESLFHEVRNYGIKAIIIFPGSVRSESHRIHDSSQLPRKIAPEEVGKACQDILNTSQRNCISRLEIRTLNSPS